MAKDITRKEGQQLNETCGWDSYSKSFVTVERSVTIALKRTKILSEYFVYWPSKHVNSVSTLTETRVVESM